jgi:hypothetical protein
MGMFLVACQGVMGDVAPDAGGLDDADADTADTSDDDADTGTGDADPDDDIDAGDGDETDTEAGGDAGRPSGVIESILAVPPEVDPGASATVTVSVMGIGPGLLTHAQVCVDAAAPTGEVFPLCSPVGDLLPGASTSVAEERGPLGVEGVWVFHATLRDRDGELLDEGPPEGTAVTVRPSRPPWDRILPVGYDEQDTNYSCGPTSTSMLLAYHGVWRDEGSISDYMGAYPSGVGREQIRDYIRDTVPELWSDIVSGWGALQAEIAAGRPAIAHLGFNAEDGDRSGAWPIATDGTAVALYFDGGHYVVVVGLVSDGAGNVAEVVCNDPANWRGGTYGDHVHYTAGSFDAAWDDDNGVTRERYSITATPR